MNFAARRVCSSDDVCAPGAKFPTVLEKRLAECKVMLVLIGPEWLNSKDDDGSRRLDNPNDWVRLKLPTP